jgi:hypothetical protein
VDIHEAEHQHVSARFVLNDGRHQPTRLAEINLHGCSFPKARKNKKPAGFALPAG